MGGDPANRSGQLDLPGFLAFGDDGSERAQATITFLLGLRARGITDLNVLRALETVPRDLFVPHRYLDLALRDVALPIGCGQTMPEPLLVARAMAALDLTPAHRVLEIGTGSGYGTAMLARLAGQVVSVERFQTLVTEAQARLTGLDIRNAKLLHGDGLNWAPDASIGLFDRIVLNGVVDDLPDGVMALLAETGRILFAQADPVTPGAQLVMLTHVKRSTFTTAPLGACRLPRLQPGVAELL